MNGLAYDPARTSLTLANGVMFDLLDPRPEQIDFDVIIQHLAKTNRYCGATQGVYSVAEHSTRCADAALASTGDRALAAYLFCHDMHEAFVGDDTTPKKRALGVVIASFGALSGAVEQAFAQLTERLDVAIHAAANLPWPPAPATAAAIHHFDRALLATEWRDLMRCPPPYDFGVAALPDRIIPAPGWTVAAGEMKALGISLLGADKFNGLA